MKLSVCAYFSIRHMVAVSLAGGAFSLATDHTDTSQRRAGFAVAIGSANKSA
jgi:hypothetical protein